MSNPFEKKPKWKNPSQWGEVQTSTITPVPKLVTTNTGRDVTAKNQNVQPESSGVKINFKKYIIPIVVIVVTLIAITIVAVIIFAIKYKNKKNGSDKKIPKKFTPGKKQEQIESNKEESEDEIEDEFVENIPEVAKKIKQSELSTQQLLKEHDIQSQQDEQQFLEEDDIPLKKRVVSLSTPELPKSPEKPLPRMSTVIPEKQPPKENVTQNTKVTASYLTSLFDKVTKDEDSVQEKDIGVVEEMEESKVENDIAVDLE